MKQRLYRSRHDRKLFGVCSGFGQYLGIDPTFVRIGVVLLTIFFGIPALIYFLLAFIMPKEPLFSSYGHGLDGQYQRLHDLDEEIERLEKRALQQEVHRLRAELAKYQ
ncbi:MAG TPA: PspC domain-containing protein [Candidatus Bathyarchaeia archaeon]|nr:PspC domain-containing protein [Candidatus Bathyarchaeia archaeon]